MAHKIIARSGPVQSAFKLAMQNLYVIELDSGTVIGANLFE